MLNFASQKRNQSIPIFFFYLPVNQQPAGTSLKIHSRIHPIRPPALPTAIGRRPSLLAQTIPRHQLQIIGNARGRQVNSRLLYLFYLAAPASLARRRPHFEAPPRDSNPRTPPPFRVRLAQGRSAVLSTAQDQKAEISHVVKSTYRARTYAQNGARRPGRGGRQVVAAHPLDLRPRQRHEPLLRGGGEAGAEPCAGGGGGPQGPRRRWG